MSQSSAIWPPNVNEGSQNCDPADATTHQVIAEETKLCKKQPSATPYGEQGKLDLATDS